MSSTRVAVLTALISASLATCCEAQIVRWGGFGGVRVRAPFVAVDVSPYGGTWVRAPFTNVYSFGPAFSYGPAFPYGPFPPAPPVVVVPAVPAIPVPSYPVPSYRVPVVPEVTYQEPSIPAEGYQVTRPSLDGHVAEDLRRAATQLQASLLRRHDGDVWINYLNPGRIIESVDRGEPPSSLRDLIANYDGVVANASLRPIYTAPGFDATRELLRVYVDLPASQRTKVPPPPATPQPPSAQPPQAQETDNGSDADQQEALPAPAPAPENPEEEQKQPTPPPPDPIPPKVSKLEPTDI